MLRSRRRRTAEAEAAALLMCGGQAALGGSARCWAPGPVAAGRRRAGPEGAFPRGARLKERRELPPTAAKRASCRPGWHPRRRGRHPSFFRAHGGGRPHYRRQEEEEETASAKAWPRCARPSRPRVLLSLRPVNLMGRRAPGMRAPRNTNQFLMQEKYQLMHLRSDSVGTESGGSDCEMDPVLDMDSYLGVLENARGALMDGPAAAAAVGGESTSGPLLGPPALGGCLEGALQEDNSLQYFPSEDDVIESELFMERDFHEFCSSFA